MPCVTTLFALAALGGAHAFTGTGIYSRVAGPGCKFFDSTRGATYDLTPLPVPLRLEEGCAKDDCSRKGSFSLLGLCEDIPSAGSPVACPAPTGTAFHVYGAQRAGVFAAETCLRLGDTVASTTVEDLPFNRTGLRMGFFGGVTSCPTEVPGRRTFELSLECDPAPAPHAPGRELDENEEATPPNTWYFMHPTYKSAWNVGCGEAARVRSPLFCPLECPRAPGSGLVCGGPSAGVCEHRETGGTRCYCFAGRTGADCGAAAPPPAPAELAPPAPPSFPPRPFSFVNGSTCVYADAELGLVYDMRALSSLIMIERPIGPDVGRVGWHYQVSLCNTAPHPGCPGEATVFQITGVQTGPNAFSQHDCISHGGDMGQYGRVSALDAPGALGFSIHISGGSACGPVSRQTILVFECDQFAAPYGPANSDPYYRRQQRQLVEWLSAGPGMVYSASADNLADPGGTGCQYTLEMKSPAFCPVQCPRHPTSGLLCGGPRVGRCGVAGSVTRCRCFSGFFGPACEFQGAAPGGGGGGGGPPDGSATSGSGQRSAGMWGMRLPWMREDRGAGMSAAAFGLIVALHALSVSVVSALAPKDASGLCRGAAGAGMFAASLVAAVLVAKGAGGMDSVCLAGP